MHRNCRTLVSIGGPYCTSHRRSVMGLEIRQSQALDRLGISADGVYTTRDRAVDEVVATYTGERLDEKQLQDIYCGGGNHGTYVYALTDATTAVDNTFCDSHRFRCVAAMINDRRGTGLKSNVYFHQDDSDTSRPMQIRTQRRLKAGEELLLSYGSSYWRGFDHLPYSYATTLA